VGRLAGHILDFAEREFPEFYATMTYLAVDRSEARRAEQRERLTRHRSRILSAAEIPAQIPSGCIFSNELFDALPTHRVAMRGGELLEIFVGFDGHRFID